MTATTGPRELFSPFGKLLPTFRISSDHIKILHEPSRFYEALLQGIATATRRIFLTSLYIGTDVLGLVEGLRVSLRVHPGLMVFVLLDLLRGNRPGPEARNASNTTAAMLLPLLHEFGPQRIVLRFYHTPNLRGIWKSITPSSLNEGFGLQHIKLCGFDDSVVLTGANLSSEYFENRQDRYYLFESPELAAFFYNFIMALSGFAYLMTVGAPSPSNTLISVFEWPTTNLLPTPLEKTDHSIIFEAARRHLVPLIWNHDRGKGEKSNQNCDENTETDTVVWPHIQLAPLLGVSDYDLRNALMLSSSHTWALGQILPLLPYCSSWTLSTAYLSLSPQIRAWLARLGTSTPSNANQQNVYASGTIITAAPEAMSFYGAKGMVKQRSQSGGSPYTTLGLPKLLQWRRGIAHEPGGWTFHAKGLWAQGLKARCGEEDTTATMTVVGSSNYGNRSWKLDLELDVLIVTTNPDLQRRMRKEEARMLRYGRPIGSKEAATGSWVDGVVVWVLMFVIRLLGLSI
ncbi:hypothetical protein GE09DRAFT_1265743 [Coniochaeta sp. 2T2.1]|nr:hypothetical protein GE09DRAFT_1265743 [Coniochaeta sp. 2T2.1]